MCCWCQLQTYSMVFIMVHTRIDNECEMTCRFFEPLQYHLFGCVKSFIMLWRKFWRNYMSASPLVFLTYHKGTTFVIKPNPLYFQWIYRIQLIKDIINFTKNICFLWLIHQEKNMIHNWFQVNIKIPKYKNEFFHFPLLQFSNVCLKIILDRDGWHKLDILFKYLHIFHAKQKL